MEAVANASTLAVGVLIVAAHLVPHLLPRMRPAHGVAVAVHVAGLLYLAALVCWGVVAVVRTANPVTLVWPVGGGAAALGIANRVAVRLGPARQG